MEQKTKINAEDGKQELVITREFDLPLELLFKAYIEPGIIEQWMGTKVLKLENKNHGGYEFETRDGKGNVVFKANGVIHKVVVNGQIIRTFEMENAPFGIQLEALQFESTGDEMSRLNMHVVYQSPELRDAMLKLPFAYGINMAHNRLQQVLGPVKMQGENT